MICPPLHVVLFYTFLMLGGVVLSLSSGCLWWLRILGAVVALLGLICFIVTGSWRSLLVAIIKDKEDSRRDDGQGGK